MNDQEFFATMQRLDATYGKLPELVAAQDELREAIEAIEAEEAAEEAQEFEDFSLEDLDRSEAMLKESLFTVNRLCGRTDAQSEIEWASIQLDAQFAVQFGDIHIEEL